MLIFFDLLVYAQGTFFVFFFFKTRREARSHSAIYINQKRLLQKREGGLYQKPSQE